MAYLVDWRSVFPFVTVFSLPNFILVSNWWGVENAIFLSFEGFFIYVGLPVCTVVPFWYYFAPFYSCSWSVFLINQDAHRWRNIFKLYRYWKLIYFVFSWFGVLEERTWLFTMVRNSWQIPIASTWYKFHNNKELFYLQPGKVWALIHTRSMFVCTE